MAIGFGSAFDHAPVPMAVVTCRSHVIVRANTALTDLLGSTRNDLVGRRLSQFRDDASAPVLLDCAVPSLDLGAGLEGGARPTFSGERACLRADGSTVWFEVHSAVLPEELDGEHLCLLHLIDITRRRAAEDARDRQNAWVSALGEVRMAVLLGVAPARALALVCARARGLLEATDAVVIVPSRDGLTGCVEAADGDEAGGLVGRTLPLDGTLAGEVVRGTRVVVRGSAGDPLTLLDGLLPAQGRGAVLALPLRTPDVVLGALCLVRRAGRQFTRPDVDIARSFADQAAAALHIGDLRADRERLRVMEDRERIARDLHDSVIQNLFAAGMSLESVRPLITSPRAAERVAATIDELDRTIKQVRSTIFELEASDLTGTSDELIRRVVESRREQLGFEPKVEIDGLLGEVSSTSMEHVLAVLSEGLSNIARHAGASSATVRLQVAPGGEVDLRIYDDGTGFDPARVPRGNGLDNMFRRAAHLHGSLDIRSNPGGTVIDLRIPAGADR